MYVYIIHTHAYTYTYTYTCALVYTTEESTQWLSMRVFLRFPFNCILAFLGGPGEGRGRLTAPAALRRRPRFARRSALRAPKFNPAAVSSILILTIVPGTSPALNKLYL